MYIRCRSLSAAATTWEPHVKHPKKPRTAKTPRCCQRLPTAVNRCQRLPTATTVGRRSEAANGCQQGLPTDAKGCQQLPTACQPLLTRFHWQLHRSAIATQIVDQKRPAATGASNNEANSRQQEMNYNKHCYKQQKWATTTSKNIKHQQQAHA